MLKPQRDRNSKAIHETPESSSFLVHIDENFAQRPVFILTRVQVNFVSADDGFLRVSGAAVW